MTRPHPINPFPSAAVARYSGFNNIGALTTVATDSMRRGVRIAEEYATSVQEAASGGSGSAIAIVGEYGTGKTHLALTMVGALKSILPDVPALYIDAAGDDFLTLYRERFIPRLDRTDLKKLIESHFADIVAESLQESELTKSVATNVRNLKVDAIRLVRSLGLMEADFQDELMARLRLVTEDQAFGSALALFLRPEFEATVWEWLCGNPPDPALVERGITKTIDTDGLALQAIGVVALLYAGKSHKFVLVLDEMERVFRSELTEELNSAFKRFLELMSHTGSLIIMCGLPEFLEALPPDAAQRISLVIRPTTLTSIDAEKYITGSIEKAIGERTLRPFSPDVVRYLVELSGGNARRLIRLCFYSYDLAVQSGASVNTALVREVARQQFQLVDGQSMRSDIERVLTRNGWLFEHVVADRKRASEFSYAVRASDLRISIVVGGSVLVDRDVARLNALLKRISQDKVEDDMASESAKRFAILIINGYLNHEFVSRLQNFGRIIEYSGSSFTGDLENTIIALVATMDRKQSQISIESITTRLDQLARQNRSISEMVEELVHRFAGSSFMHEQVRSGLSDFFSGLSGSGKMRLQGFPQVKAVFDEAYRILSRAPTSQSIYSRSLATYRDDGDPVRHERLTDSYLYSASWHSLRQLVESFEAELSQRLNYEVSVGAIARSHLRNELRQAILSACRAYDDAVEVILPRRDASGDILNSLDDSSNASGEGLEFIRRLGPRVYEEIDQLNDSLH